MVSSLAKAAARMQRSFGPRSTVAHERAGSNGRFRTVVRIGPLREQNSSDKILRGSSGG
jgi:hypothetical protein